MNTSNALGTPILQLHEQKCFHGLSKSFIRTAWI